MVTTGRVREIFADARDVHAGALDQLAGRDIRDAAEKAWCVTKRAIDALILLRTGQEPPTTALTTEGLLALARESAEVEYLVGRYFTRISYLHGSCFYNGMCGPYTERRIRQTLDYIEDAEKLADIEGTIRLGCRGCPPRLRSGGRGRTGGLHGDVVLSGGTRRRERTGPPGLSSCCSTTGSRRAGSRQSSDRK